MDGVAGDFLRAPVVVGKIATINVFKIVGVDPALPLYFGVFGGLEHGGKRKTTSAAGACRRGGRRRWGRRRGRRSRGGGRGLLRVGCLRHRWLVGIAGGLGVAVWRIRGRGFPTHVLVQGGVGGYGVHGHVGGFRLLGCWRVVVRCFLEVLEQRLLCPTAVGAGRLRLEHGGGLLRIVDNGVRSIKHHGFLGVVIGLVIHGRLHRFDVDKLIGLVLVRMPV